MNQAEFSGRGIGVGLAWWLEVERYHADSGRNEYLSSPERLAEITLTFDDPGNTHAQKVRSHYDRLVSHGSGLTASRMGNDKFAAKTIFLCAMELSGVQRMQTYYRSRGPLNYALRRHQILYPRLSDPIKHIPRDVFREITGRKDPRALGAIARAYLLSINEKCLRQEEKFYKITSDKESSTNDRSPKPKENPLRILNTIEQNWLGVSAALVIVSARFRGDDVTKVPILEPRSITDAHELVYPFHPVALQYTE